MAGPLFEMFAKLVLDSGEFQSGIDKSRGLAKSFVSSVGGGLGTMAKVGAAAMGAATAAVGAFATSSVNAGMNFDEAMSQVQATMLKTADEMEKEVGSVETAYGHFEGNLREFAQFLGSNTAFSATEAAEALNYMALAGYDTQQSMEMLPNVLSLAAAGGFDLARASDMVTDAQTAFGISSERTTQMVDEMAKAASTGNTSVEQLGDAFLTIGGLAQELNGGMVDLADGTQQPVDGLQELEIALTAMANAGIKGSEAGTHMRNMLMRLSSPTDAGVKALESMGVAVFDTQGKMRSLSDIFEELSGAMSNMTQEQKIQTISDLFNARDLSSAEALLNAISQDWDNIGESILNAEGSAAEMADIQLDNLAGDITLFKSALEGAQIVVSDALTPSLREFVQLGTQGLSDLTEGFKEGGLDGAMEALGGTISDGIAIIVEKVPEAVTAAAALLSALVEGIIANAPQLADAAVEVAEMLFGYIQEAAPKLLDAGISLIDKLADGAAEGIPALLEKVLPMLVDFSASLRENAGLLIDAGLNLLVNLAQGIADGLPALIENLPEIVTNIANIINDNAPKILAAGVQIILTLIVGIIKAIPTLIANIPKIVEAIFSVILAVNWVSLGGDIVRGIGSGIKAIAKEPVNAIRNMIDGLVNIIRHPIQSAYQWGIDLISNFSGGIIARAKKLFDTVRGIAQGIKKFIGFSEPEEGPLSDFHTYAPDMMQLFAKGIKDNANLISDQFEESLNLPMEGLANDWKDMSSQMFDGDFSAADVNNRMDVIPGPLNQPAQQRDIITNLYLERDKLAHAIYTLYNEEAQRVGLNLVGVN